MGLTYDTTEDFLYKEGLTKGEEKGQKARERNIIINMLKDKTLSMEKIVELADVSVEYVKQLAQPF